MKKTCQIHPEIRKSGEAVKFVKKNGYAGYMQGAEKFEYKKEFPEATQMKISVGGEDVTVFCRDFIFIEEDI